MWKKRLKSNWKRPFIILLCLGLIVAHSIWPQLKFDAVNIGLGAIIGILFLIPNPTVFLPYMKRIKRVKAWDLEFELGELQQEVEKAEKSLASSPDIEMPKNVPPEVEEVL